MGFRTSMRRAGGRVRRLFPPLESRSFMWRYWATLLGVWAAAAFLVVPVLIRGAHAGWLPPLDRMLSGRHDSPVSEYLAMWRDSIPSLTFVAVTAALLLFVVLLLVREPRLARSRRDDPASSAASAGPPLTPAAILLLAAWFGLLVGVGEAYYLAGRAFVLGSVVLDLRFVSPDSLWMAPLVAVALFVAVACGLVLISRLVARVGSVGAVVLLFTFLTTYSWLRTTNRVTALAATILAVGVAVQCARFAASNASSLTPLVRRSGAWLIGLVLVVGVGVIGWPLISEGRALSRLPAARHDALNVLLIVLDTQRADNTSLYGSARRTTPNLEQWAAKGVIFDYAIAPAPWTLPSHATMFTGRYNLELETQPFTPLDDRFLTLAEVLREHGYSTAGFVANIAFASDFYGLDQGFIRYEDQPRSLQMALASFGLTRRLDKRIRTRLGNHHRLVRKRADAINRNFLRWIDHRATRPFFAFLNYFDAHNPYLPPAPFDTLYGARGGAHTLKGGATGDESVRYSTAELEQMEASYDAGITYLDHYIGRLFQALKERDLLSRTMVIVTSDHGEEFGEHGYVGHDDDLYLPQLRVPLVIWAPEGRQGSRVSAPVSLRDLPATILDVLEMPGALPGHSFRPFLSAGLASTDPAPAFSDRGLNVEWSVVDGRYHYLIQRDGGELLFDFVDDPAEIRDISGEADAAPIMSAFRDYLEREVRPLSPERYRRMMEGQMSTEGTRNEGG